MKLANLAFAGGDLNRAADLRGPKAQESLWADNRARAALMWRGKPLLIDSYDGQGAELVWLRPDHLMVRNFGGERMFLGLCPEKRPLFGIDVSNWEPEEEGTTVGAFVDPSVQSHDSLPKGSRFAELRAMMTQMSPHDGEIAASLRALLEWHRTHAFCSKCGQTSTAEMGGWQRNCVSCAGQHFPRTDPVVIMLITHQNSVLIGRSQGWPDGMYSLLAGFVEPGETIEAAVRREVFEESGIRVGDVTYLTSQPWPFPACLMMGCYGAALNTDIKLDENELEDAIWITREGMMQVYAGDHPSIKPARRGSIAFYLLQNWLKDV